MSNHSLLGTYMRILQRLELPRQYTGFSVQEKIYSRYSYRMQKIHAQRYIYVYIHIYTSV